MDAFSPGTLVGFVGLGIMGRPMARNLLKAGFPLLVHDRLREPVAEIVAAGARDAGSLSGCAEARLVVTMLPDTPDVEAVLFGGAPLPGAMRPGSVLVDMSTISPIATRDFCARLAGGGVTMLDAPVSGGYQGAEAGTLSIMVGGEAAALERCRPVLSAMGTTISHIGESGAGQVCKACNQVACVITIEAVAEALTLARKSGVDPAKVRAALLGLRIALETAQASGVPLPATALIQQLYSMLAATGRGDLDNSSLALLLEELAGLRPRG
jgi:2-hydroxy-3-oxopropionate reductase